MDCFLWVLMGPGRQCTDGEFLKCTTNSDEAQIHTLIDVIKKCYTLQFMIKLITFFGFSNN
jgi:hypothetical protein